MSFRDLIVRAVPKQEPAPKPARKPAGKTEDRPSPRAAKPKSSGWGTPEERYRRLCLLAQLCRYAYYVKHVSIIPDGVYDKLERVILCIEDQNREIIDNRRSPTGKPGSDRAESYPRTVLSLWDFCGDDPRSISLPPRLRLFTECPTRLADT